MVLVGTYLSLEAAPKLYFSAVVEAATDSHQLRATQGTSHCRAGSRCNLLRGKLTPSATPQALPSALPILDFSGCRVKTTFTGGVEPELGRVGSSAGPLNYATHRLLCACARKL